MLRRWTTASIPVLISCTAAAQTVLLSAPLTTNEYPIAVGDLDGDGIRDLAITSAATLKMHALPSLALLAQFSGAWLVPVDCGDMDGDGHDDLVVRRVAGLEIVSSATWNVLLTIPLASYASGNWYWGVLGDVTGDGRTDFTVADDQASVGGVAFAGRMDIVDGVTGAVVRSELGSIPGEHLGRHRVLGDLDGDGLRDYLLTSATGSWFRSGQTGQTLFTMPTSLALSYHDVGDVNGDGRDDFAEVNSGGGHGAQGAGGRVASGLNGSTLFSFSLSFSTLVGYGSVGSCGDLDGDGFGDVTMVGGDHNLVRSGRTQATLLRYNHNPAGLLGGSAGDFDGDGFQDVWVKLPLAAQIHSGRPPGVTSSGTGCPDTAGVVPHLGVSVGPRLGRQMQINLSDASPNCAAAVLVLGYSDQQWSGMPLPADLGLVGLPGCVWRVSADAMPLVATSGPAGASRNANYPLTVPSDPSLLGLVLFAQWIVFEANPAVLSGAVTRLVRLQVVP